MSLVVDEHRSYLADELRLETFRRAIGLVVRPGDVVLDLGSGTGVLGILAARAGAARVHCVEQTSLVAATREIIEANALSDRITVHRGDSTEIELPEHVDVIVADQIGRIGFDAGILEYFEDARRRHLREGGRMIPQRIGIALACLDAPHAWAAVDFWNRPHSGVDFSPLGRLAVNTGYPVDLAASSVISDPVIAAVRNADDASPFSAAVELEIARQGVFHGVGGWFTSDLASGVTMTNSPLDPGRITRRQAFLPVGSPVPVVPGMRVRVDIDVIPAETILTWRVRVLGQAPDALPTDEVHSTWFGMLLSEEDVRGGHPDHVPVLTSRGRGRRSVLELCDGQTPLGEIEAEMLRRHPDLFAAPADAQGFVAEVVSRYTR